MTSVTPLVSVIIPTFNRADLLPQTIESCLAQTYRNLEVIVVDDGSTDATAEVVARYGPKVIYVKQDRQGVGRARRRGVQQASGEYITFLDSDDLMLPTKIERQAQVLAEHPEVGLCHGWYYAIDEHGRKLDLMTDIPETDVLTELICRCFIWSGAPLVRRASLEALGVCGAAWERGIYDWDLWLHIALAGHRFFCIRAPLGAYRIHASALSSNIQVVARRIFGILDRVYDDPRTPAALHPVKERAYATWHTWFAFRSYAACAWEAAQRHLTLALASAESPIAHPAALARQIAYHAVNGRSADPLKYLDDVFAHLPPQVEGVQAYHRQVRAYVHQVLALRLYRFGNCIAASEHLAQAIKLDPDLITQPDRFMDQVIYHAVHLSDDAAEAYINRVMQNLPPEANALHSLHVPLLERLGGWAYLEQARGDYVAGVFPAARAYFMHTLAREPTLAANPEAFAHALVQQALRLPDPEGYARWVLANLPPSLAGLSACQARILGILSLKRAFDSYALGQRAETLANAFRAIRYLPSSIANRGVIAIIARSLLPELR
ncbi:MAG: glycosyltransferase family A protein [Oscillochloridaceae bacterium]|nr:glycosyltransferase family 2 protein [Chloroflexaceae bacterium]MDW8389819.1 glycosyltransferase family A protein [Oscillochloridaceae bacterium]